MVAGKKPEQTGAEYLNALFGLSGRRITANIAYPFGAQSAVWVDEVKDQRVRLKSGGTFRFPVHTGIQVGQRGSLEIPGPATVVVWTPWLPDSGPKNWDGQIKIEVFKKEIAQFFSVGLGSLILSRETNVNYMETTK